MRWKKERLKDGAILFSAMIDGDEASAFSDLWRQIVNEVLPINESIGWTRLRAEIWSDSSRVLVFPEKESPGGKSRREEKALCALTIPRIKSVFSGLIDSTEDDEVVGAGMTTLHEELAAKMVNAGRALAPADLSVAFFSEDDPEPFLLSRM